jgi:hypothetical protein
LNNDLDNRSRTSGIAMGWQRVLSHLGAIIIGSLLTKSRIISKEALPEPTIIPALSVVVGKVPVFRMVSTFFLEPNALTKNLR